LTSGSENLWRRVLSRLNFDVVVVRVIQGGTGWIKYDLVEIHNCLRHTIIY
jgi:hypothetical protein